MSARPLPLPRRRFLGVDFTPLDLDTATRTVVERPADAPFAYVVTPNAQHVVAAHAGDARFRSGQAGAWMVLNDSRILRLLSRHLFGLDLPLAAGSDVTTRLFQTGIGPHTSLTLIGGDAALEVQLRRDFGVRNIARLNPSFGFYRDPIEVQRCLDFVCDNPAPMSSSSSAHPSPRCWRKPWSANPASPASVCVSAAR